MRERRRFRPEVSEAECLEGRCLLNGAAAHARHHAAAHARHHAAVHVAAHHAARPAAHAHRVGARAAGRHVATPLGRVHGLAPSTSLAGAKGLILVAPATSTAAASTTATAATATPAAATDAALAGFTAPVAGGGGSVAPFFDNVGAPFVGPGGVAGPADEFAAGNGGVGDLEQFGTGLILVDNESITTFDPALRVPSVGGLRIGQTSIPGPLNGLPTFVNTGAATPTFVPNGFNNPALAGYVLGTAPTLNGPPGAGAGGPSIYTTAAAGYGSFTSGTGPYANPIPGFGTFGGTPGTGSVITDPAAYSSGFGYATGPLTGTPSPVFGPNPGVVPTSAPITGNPAILSSQLGGFGGYGGYGTGPAGFNPANLGMTGVLMVGSNTMA